MVAAAGSRGGRGGGRSSKRLLGKPELHLFFNVSVAAVSTVKSIECPHRLVGDR